MQIIGPTRVNFVSCRFLWGMGYHGYQGRDISGISMSTSGRIHIHTHYHSSTLQHICMLGEYLYALPPVDLHELTQTRWETGEPAGFFWGLPGAGPPSANSPWGSSRFGGGVSYCLVSRPQRRPRRRRRHLLRLRKRILRLSFLRRCAGRCLIRDAVQRSDSGGGF